MEKDLIAALSADQHVSNARILTPPTSPSSVHTLLNSDLSFNYRTNGDVVTEVIELVTDSLFGLGYIPCHPTKSANLTPPHHSHRHSREIRLKDYCVYHLCRTFRGIDLNPHHSSSGLRPATPPHKKKSSPETSHLVGIFISPIQQSYYDKITQ